jgi:8-oxo-dGTP diphosphatase
MEADITKVYGNRVRIRVCGLCWTDRGLLMVNHKSLKSSDFWAPPGGGVEFGETLECNLKREFREETGLEIAVGPFLFGCEFIQRPLHAVELFFEVFITGGTLQVGVDPELPLIQDVRFLKTFDLEGLKENELHGIFRRAMSPEDFKNLHGFYQI